VRELVLTTVVWMVAAAGCGAEPSGECPVGTTFRDPLCLPAWTGGTCDQDEDDFLDPACGGNDCAPDNFHVHPRAVETCNGVDDDCDGLTDEDAIARDWYRDEDGDEWGGGTPAWRQCSQPAGAAGRGGDCDDGNADRHPGADERCDGVDDDCDGFTDEGVRTRFYRDRDSDGFGTPLEFSDACDPPAGFVRAAGDCDDENRDVRPDQPNFFPMPAGPAGFDYDCDGRETPQETTVVGDCSACTTLVSGWSGTAVPGCGETGTWLECRSDGAGGCVEQSRRTGQVQRCR